MDIRSRRRRSGQRLVVTLFGIALLLFLLDAVGVLGNVLNLARGPLAGLIGVGSRLGEWAGRPFGSAETADELAALRARVGALERENEQLRNMTAQVGPALELLGRQNESTEITRVVAAVVGRGPNPLFRDLIINKGTNDGVRVGMAVESARGLVGQIYRASANASQVLLIDSPESAIPARLSQSRADGIVKGGGAGGLLVMNWLSLEAQVVLNDIVVTSGLSNSTPEERIANRFPPGIVLGRITDVQRSPANLFQDAVVQPVVDFNSLETVFVLTGFTPVDNNQFAPQTP